MMPARHSSYSLRRAGVVLTLLLLLGLVLGGSPALADGTPTGTADQQIEALLAAKEQRTPAQRKVSSQLLVAAEQLAEAEAEGSGQPPEADGSRQPRGSVPPGRQQAADPDSVTELELVMVDIRANVTAAVLARIRALGGTVINSVPERRAIRARLPLAAVEQLAALDAVQFIRPADEAVTRKDNTSEGVAAHLVNQARTTYSVTGAGIGIGVLSDGVDTLAERQKTGDVPARVTVLPGQEGTGREGTAMLEIVHDLAPGAELYFATGFTGQAQFAANIEALCEAGADVIVDDIGYFLEANFQDGIIAQGVNAATEGGCYFFSAAGNDGNLNDGTSGVWEGDYAAGTPLTVEGETLGVRHDFGSDQEENPVVEEAFYGTVVLQWADPLGGSENDYDLFLVDGDGNVIASSTNTQDGAQDPFESISTGFFAYSDARLVIVKVKGDDLYLRLQTFNTKLEIATAGNTWGHPAAENAMGVAQVHVRDAGGDGGVFDGTEDVASSSSDGPRRVFFQPGGTAITAGNFSSTGGRVVQKPDLTAAGCVSTATPRFATFCGTSAAAPHAAAIAALMLEAAGGPAHLDLEALRTAMTATTAVLDIEAPLVDRDSGAGIVMAPGALAGVAVLIADRNGAPTVTTTLAGRTLAAGSAAVTVDLASIFADPDSDTLSYSVVSSDPDRLAVTLSGTVVTLTPGSPGRSVVSVRVTDPGGLGALETFTVTVTAGNTDYDKDNDGFIEITTLAQLNAVRYDLDGDGLVDGATWEPYYAAGAFPMGALDMGCPPDGCVGYELSADLDFDTDGNGTADSGDTYWNDGDGWAPIGSEDSPFTANFTGNGYTLTNLFINRPAEDGIGLFGEVQSPVRGRGVILNVGLIKVDVTGSDAVGSLFGRTDYGVVIGSYATGRVAGRDQVGGLVGESWGNLIDTYAAVKVSGDEAVGGLIGHHLLNRITTSYATGSVSGMYAVGGLVGATSDAYQLIQASYATGDVSGQGARLSPSDSGFIVCGNLGGRSAETSSGGGVGGLAGSSCGIIDASYATGTVSGDVAVGGLVGSGRYLWAFVLSYWDTETSGLRVGVGADDTNDNGVIDGEELQRVRFAGLSTAELQAPTDYEGIYLTWDVDLGGGAPDYPWDFGTTAQYPVLSRDLSHDDVATWEEFGYQFRTRPSLTATTPDGQVQVDLSWDAADVSPWTPAPSVTYTVYRDDGSTVESLATDLSGTTYADTDVTTAARYTYWVAAVIAGGEVARSTPAPVTAGAANQPPVATGTLKDVTLLLGADAVAVDVAGAFRDPDDDLLAYTAAASDTSVATVSKSGSQVTITPVGAGRAIVTVTATDTGGSNQSATQRFKVAVGNDYDADDDRLVEIRTLAQLDAMRLNLDGGVIASDPAAYALAFPAAIENMGCGLEGCSGYELVADLDFDTNGDGMVDSNDAYWNDGAGWAPIGVPEFLTFGAFNTTFDGNDNVIMNLFVRGEDFAGLFGALGQSDVIRNVSLTGVDVVGVDFVGGLVGYNYGAVIASETTGQVTGDDGVGGLVGENYGTITRSRSFATLAHQSEPFSCPPPLTICVISLTNFPGIGGLVGVNDGSITASYATGAVDGYPAGGLVGYNGGVIVSSYATGPVTGSTVGGLVGRNGRNGRIYASYATGRVSGNYEAGGLVGFNSRLINSSYATGPVSGSRYTDVGGLAGSGGHNARASYWDSTTSGINGGSTTAELQAPTGYRGIYESWDLDLYGDSARDDPWDFGTTTQYPALSVDFDGDGQATWQEFGYQLRAGPALTADAKQGQAVLAWSAVASGHWTPPPGITYNIYRSKDATVETLVENLDALEYTDSNATDGPYIYQVAAVVDGGQATHSAMVAASSASNTAPEFPSSETGVRSIPENTAAGVNIGAAVAATDADSDPLTYSLDAAGATFFDIDSSSGQLKTKVLLNYEKTKTHTFTLTVSDYAAASDTITVRVNVTNAEDPGTVTLLPAQPQVGAKLTAKLTDPDDVLGKPGWSWERSTNSAGPWTAISSATSAKYTPTADDLNRYLRANASYNDRLGTGKSASGVSTNAVAPQLPNTSLSPSASDPYAIPSTAVYTVTFEGQWIAAATPVGVPGGAHFSRLIGAVHNADVTFLRSGEAATAGIESMAEDGGTSALGSEVTNAGTNALSIVRGNTGFIGATTSKALTVTLTNDHPRVTLVTMIAPSPDWFVGVSGLTLLDAGGDWVESLQVDLYPWDAGTEDGSGFSTSNSATSPQGVITNLRGAGQFSNERIATMTFTRQSLNIPPTGAPIITGTAEAGEELTAYTSGIADADGLNNVSYAYQWVRVASGGRESDIRGARSSTYTAQPGDVDSRLKVRVSFTDDAGNPETLTSNATAAVIVAQVTVRFGGSVYTATEGGASARVTVVLDKDPHRRLTVPLTNTPRGGAIADDYAAPAQVVFNAGETSKNVTVTARDDDVDDDGESVNLAFGMLPDGVRVGSPASAVVQITDNDTAGVTLGRTALTVAENGRATYTVALKSEPTADVTVTITGHTGTDLTLTPATAMLTFTPSTWDRTQTVTVAAGDDGDVLNDSARLTHRARGAAEYASVAVVALSVTVTDDDAKATGAPAITGTAEVGERLTANTSGIADADGLNDVSYSYQWVRVASGGRETNIFGETSAVYTVTVGDVGNAFKLKVTFTDDKGNPELAESAPTAVATVAQVKVSFGAAAYGAAEGGPAATVTVVLDKDPHRSVVILLTATPGGGANTGDYTVAPIAVVFNAGETSKDVTVTARDDSVDDDGESVELSFGRLPDGVSEGATASAVVQITDNDGNGIVLTPTSLTVAEGGSSTYTVALDSPPTAGVGVTISGHSGTDLGLNRTSLSFTTSNWNVGQSVTARASQDNDSDNDSATLTHTASGGGYTGVTAALAVTVTDDDAKATGEPVISGSPEVGETLRADTSQIMDADGLSRPGYRYQWVRVASGGVETDIPRATSATYRVVADDVGVALKVKTTFTDDKGNPESAASALTAVVTVAQVVASFGPGPYAALEGGSVRVRVALDKDPHRTVTIPLIAVPRDGADSRDYVAPTEVVFNAGETTKDVTVTAVDDSVDDDGESVELVFGRLPVGVSDGATTRAVVQITDNDGRGIDLSRTSLAVSEGGSVTYTVALASRPTTTVTVTITGHLGTDVSLDRTSLFFTASTWNTAQVVMVSAAQDLDATNDSATLTHTASGADYGSVTAEVTVTVVDGTVEDVNEPPVATGTETFTFRENGTAALYTFRATDPERSAITWSVTGTDEDYFAISETGVLSFANPPDYESPADSGRDNVYEVTVVAQDDAFNSGTLDVVVTVTDQNEGPEISGQQSLSFTENQATERVLATYTGRDPEDPSADITRWSLSGTDAGDFTIDENGQLTFRNVPNYERPADSGRDNVYNLSVRASDGRNYGYLEVTVTVEDVNEAPAVTGTDSFTFRENGTAALHTFRATDPERSAITWSVTGTDDDDFAISETGVLSFANPPNYESPAYSDRDNVYEVTVVARDDAFNSGTLDVVVTVTDVNEGPEVAGTTSLSFTENQASDRVLATYTATDPEDPSASITRWSLTGADAGDFTIDENGQLTFRNVPDYERPADSGRDNVYNLSVRASDGRNYGYLEVTVTVQDVNEPPAVTGTDSFTFRENGTATLHTFRATDPERSAIEWSLSGPDDDFTIGETGVLSFANPPDYESPADSGRDNVYEVTVVARDDASNSGTLDVVVTVTDQNEGPEVAGTTSLSFTENQATERVLTTYTATDPEDPGAIITRWSLTGTDAGDFTIDESGQLTFRNVPDYERPADSGRDNVYNLSVRASDGRNYGYLAVTVTVQDVNEPPVVTGTITFTFRENGTAALHTFRATDPERSAITWSLLGADDDDFTISETGVLSFANPPDYESPADSGRDNVYEVTVVARDDAFNTGTLDVVVTVTDQNEGPEISGQQSLSFTENQATERVLATYTATDPEDTSAVITRWSLTGTDAGDFTIDESGQLTFRNVPDYERPADSGRDNVYNLSVRASDGRNYGYLEMTVTVEDVNEPQVATGTETFTFRENGTATLHTFRATDPERSAIEWSLSGLDEDGFTIGETGVLSFASPPDYESPADSGRDNVYEVTVVAQDDAFNSGALDVVVTVTDVNEGPEVAGTTSLSFTENQATDRALASYTATDPEDPGAVITRWSLTGRDAGDFTIDENGQLTFRNVPDYERPVDSGRDNVYNLSVRASDGRNYGYLEVTVTVQDVNEPPAVTGTDSFTFRENGTATLYTFRATDPERSAITWSVTGTDRDDFTISETGVLAFANPPDYESPTDSGRDNVYEVTVEARDDALNTGTLEVVVTVTDVNEGPEISGQQSLSFTENQASDRVLAAYTGRDPEDPSAAITRWSLTGTDAGDFTIDESGQLTFRNAPDYERPADSGRDNVYNLSVRASDGRNYGYLEMTVTVEDVNEPPVATGTETFTFRENGTATLHTFRATDPERSAIEWSLSGADDDDFTIGETGVLAFASPPDYESPADSGRDNVYEVTVVARDDAFNSGTLDVAVTVTDQNEGPEISGSVSLTFTENVETERVLATYSGRDPEDPSADITRWSLSGTDAGDFAIDENGQLTFRNAPDYERPADSGRDNVYNLSVRASDGRNYGYLEVTVTVEDVNEPPTVTGTDSFTFRENGTATLYTFRATDPERSAITWSVTGTDRDDFTISETGVLAFANPPDYESPADSGRDNVYEVTVEARDDALNTGTLEVVVTVTDVNEGPEISGQQSLSFTENQASDRVLAAYTGRDPEDPSAAITRWSLTGTDAGDFTIDESGQLTFRNAPDYERPADSGRDNVYNLSVRASDGRNYGYLEVTVTVEDVNEPPAVTGTVTFTYRENGTATLHTFRATDPERSAITWSVTGTDRDDFTISETGVLAFTNPPDYESPADSGRDNIYEVTVEARDDAFNTGTLEVVVTVTDVNEGPEVAGTTSLSFTENQTTERVLAAYTATDPEDPSASITRWSLTGADAGDFTIDESGQLTFRNAPDYERPADSGRDNVYNLSVRASDGRNYGYLEMTVTVQDVNEPPTITTISRASFTYRENGKAALHTFRATDPEQSAIAWSVTGTDRDDFAISETGVLAFTSSPNYESPTDSGRDNVYEVTVVAKDDAFNSGTLDVVVTVTDQNEGPEISGQQSLSFTENQTTERVLATYTATDPEDPSALITRWSLTGTDAGDFTIDENGQLTFRNVPNYERPADSGRDNVYNLSVRASDGSLYGYLEVTVTVEDVNEPPAVTGTDTFTYRENGTAALYTFRATDPERSAIAWSVTGTDRDDFTISETGVLSFANPPDYESPADSGRDNVYEVTVVAKDDASNSGTLDMTVTVTDQNEGPEISGQQSLSFTENLASDRVLATYSATDPEDTSAVITRWSLTGADAGDFTIDESGQLTFRNVPDHEKPADSGRNNEYNFSVRASDGSLYGYLEVTVTVQDVNELPAVTGTDTFTFRENGTATLHTFRATDPERSAVTWSVTGTDEDDFTIGETGVLAFANPPNYESPADSGRDNVYEVTVVAQDDAFNSGALDVVVTVTDVNEGPEVAGTTSLSFTENQATDRALATYTGRDPEDTSAVITRWSLTGADAGDFTIDENGQLTFRNVPDYERPVDSGRDNVYNLSVRASDGRNYGYLEVTVTVENVNEPPAVTGTDTFTFRENGTATLHTFRATDPESSAITWSVTGTDEDYFTIGETGVLAFANPPNYESPADSGRDNVYEVTVVARDDAFNSGMLDVVVTVTDVNEGPEISGQQSLSFTENQATDRVLAAYTATDPEDTSAVITRWSLTGADAGDFTIDENGQLTFRNVPDYERPADSGRDNVYNLSVRASDGRNYGYLEVTVTVQDVNEPPTITTISRASFTYRENGKAALHTFRATDPERSAITWSVTGTDRDDFTISETGVLAFANPPDYESPTDSDRDNVYEVTVVARDDAFNTGTLQITITVINLTD